MMFKKLTIIFLFLLLNACATPYQAHGWRGGYSELQLNKDRFQVEFNGNNATSKSTVDKYLLRRCAELTVQNNYNYFIVESSATDVKKQKVSDTSCSTSGSYKNINNGLNYGSSSGNYNATTTCYPPSYTNKYGSSAIIKMYETNDKVKNSLDAHIILKQFAVNK